MKPAVVLASAALLSSAFLPWIVLPPIIGDDALELTPWRLIEPVLDQQPGHNSPGPEDLPPVMWLYFASFAAAGLIAIAGLLNRVRRWEVILVGAMPFAVIAWVVTVAVVELDRSGIPAGELLDGARALGADARGAQAALGEIVQHLGAGFYIHYLSAAALLILGFRIPSSQGAG